MTQSEAKAMLRRSWPDGPVHRLRLLGAGDSYWAYLLNEEWVCRVAWTPAARRGLRHECALLPLLAPLLPLPIAAPQRTGSDAQGHLLFAAHPFLPGPSLSPARYARLDDASRARCAAQLARFLARLHAVDPALARGVPAFTFAGLRAYLWARAQRRLYPAAASVEQQFLARVLGPGDGPEAPGAARAGWLHGDLSHDHVLLDPAAGAISAIIDFGDMRRGEPAWDLVFLYRDYGPAFLAQVLPDYAPPADHAVLVHRVYQGYQLAALDRALDREAQGAAGAARAAVRRLRTRENPQYRALLVACGVG